MSDDKKIISLDQAGAPVPTLPKPLEDLLVERAKIDAEMRPMMSTYQLNAAKALDLNKAILKQRLEAAFTEAAWDTNTPVCTLPARDEPERTNQAIEELKKQNVKVTRITFDPMTANFMLFTNHEK